MKFMVVVSLCSVVQPEQCETHRVKEYVLMPLPYTCALVGQQVAARYLRDGLRVGRIKCYDPERWDRYVNSKKAGDLPVADKK